MASFGTGVATGQLHEITDISIATDYSKGSIQKSTGQSDPDKETSVVSVDNIGTSGQAEVNLEKESTENCSRLRNDSISLLDIQTNESDDGKSKLDIQNDENQVVALEGKALEAIGTVENMETIHPPPKMLVESETDVIKNELDNEAKGDNHLEISQDLIDEFEKHVQSKTSLKSDLQSSERKHVDDRTASTLNDDNVSGTNVTVATYTSTKTAKDMTETQSPATKSKDISGLSSRQTTSSSAGARSDSQSESIVGKPDSGYGRRRQRRRQGDIQTNHSRQSSYSRAKECSKDEAVAVKNQEQYESLHKIEDEYLNDRFQSPRQPFEDGTTQKTLLELMTRGLGNFTEQMANVMIEKIRPEYEALSRQVAKEVQEATMFELKELREKIVNAQKALKDLEKEKDHLKKLLDNEKTKRVKETEDKDTQIKKLEKDLEQSKASLKERDRVVKKAEHRAKAEEQKRVQLEQEYQEQCASLKRLLDRAKGDLLVYRSKKRVAQSNEKQDVITLTNRLSSHH